MGLRFRVHWAHIQLVFSASALVGTLNGEKYRETPSKVRFVLMSFGGQVLIIYLNVPTFAGSIARRPQGHTLQPFSVRIFFQDFFFFR
jgi:hypothetical protein